MFYQTNTAHKATEHIFSPW